MRRANDRYLGLAHQTMHFRRLFVAKGGEVGPARSSVPGAIAPMRTTLTSIPRLPVALIRLTIYRVGCTRHHGPKMSGRQPEGATSPDDLLHLPLVDVTIGGGDSHAGDDQ